MKSIAIKLIKKERYLSEITVRNAVVSGVNNRFPTEQTILNQLIASIIEDGYATKIEAMLKYSES